MSTRHFHATLAVAACLLTTTAARAQAPNAAPPPPPSVKTGQAAPVQIDALPGRTFTARVGPLSASASRGSYFETTAVRQFDYSVPGRRWAQNLPPLPPSREGVPSWLRWALIGTALVLVFSAGFLLGQYPIDWDALRATPEPIVPKPADQLRAD